MRALSPGINDPYTAITCIDNLSAIMAKLMKTPFPHKHKYDAEGNLRMIVDILTFDGMLDAAFNQIRQFAGTSPAVLIRMMEAINNIYKFTQNDFQREQLKKHADMILRSANENFLEKNDQTDMERRYKLYHELP